MKMVLVPGAIFTNNDAAQGAQTREIKNSIEQRLTIYAQVPEQADQMRTNIFEDISAAHDSHQVIIATLGDVILAKRVTAKVGATQWLGQMSDATVQHLLQDRAI